MPKVKTIMQYAMLQEISRALGSIRDTSGRIRGTIEVYLIIFRKVVCTLGE